MLQAFFEFHHLPPFPYRFYGKKEEYRCQRDQIDETPAVKKASCYGPEMVLRAEEFQCVYQSGGDEDKHLIKKVNRRAMAAVTMKATI